MNRNIKEVSDLERKEIADFYESGHKIAVIARKYRIGRRAILNILRSQGVYKINKFMNLTGQTFGYLEVIGMTKVNNGKRRSVMAICKCNNCRNPRHLVLPINLKRGHTISCGCYREHYKNITGSKNKVFTGYKEIRGTFWFRLKQGAHRRGLAFDITIEDAWNLYEKQNKLCALTGLPISFGRTGRKDENTASLDRKDSLKGYTMDNVQWVYKTINGMKMCFPQEYFINFCRLVANNPSLSYVKNLTTEEILQSEESYSGKRKFN